MKIPNYDKTTKNKNEIVCLNKCIHICLMIHSEYLFGETQAVEKTNLLYHILMKPTLHYEKSIFMEKILNKTNIKEMIQTFDPISKEVGNNIICSLNDKIIPVSELEYKQANQVVILAILYVKKIKSH